MAEFASFGIKPTLATFQGDKIRMSKIIDKKITVHKFTIGTSKFTEKGNGQCLTMQIELEQKLSVVFSGSIHLMDMIKQVPTFPFDTTIIEHNDKRLEFT